MKSTLLHDDEGRKTFALVFDKGDEVVAGLTEFARRETIASGHFTAIGALSRATIGYFDRARRDYTRIAIDEQVEVLSLLGDIAQDQDAPKIHAHIVLGRADGSAWGGHLLDARVWPTLEVILEESPRHLRRRHDPETGLGLIDLDAGRRAA